MVVDDCNIICDVSILIKELPAAENQRSWTHFATRKRDGRFPWHIQTVSGCSIPPTRHFLLLLVRSHWATRTVCLLWDHLKQKNSSLRTVCGCRIWSPFVTLSPYLYAHNIVVPRRSKWYFIENNTRQLSSLFNGAEIWSRMWLNYGLLSILQLTMSGPKNVYDVF